LAASFSGSIFISTGELSSSQICETFMAKRAEPANSLSCGPISRSRNFLQQRKQQRIKLKALAATAAVAATAVLFSRGFSSSRAPPTKPGISSTVGSR
jgi:hypothetical protein